MMVHDLGARCSKHAGEVWLPRCYECDDANRELEQERAQERHQRAIERNAALGITPNRTTLRPRFPRRR